MLPQDNPAFASMARCLAVFQSMLGEVVKENGILLPFDYNQYLVNPGPDRYLKRWIGFAQKAKQSQKCQAEPMVDQHFASASAAAAAAALVERFDIEPYSDFSSK